MIFVICYFGRYSYIIGNISALETFIVAKRWSAINQVNIIRFLNWKRSDAKCCWLIAKYDVYLVWFCSFVVFGRYSYIIGNISALEPCRVVKRWSTIDQVNIIYLLNWKRSDAKCCWLIAKYDVYLVWFCSFVILVDIPIFTVISLHWSRLESSNIDNLLIRYI